MRAAAIVGVGSLGQNPLEMIELDRPRLEGGQVLLKVLACGVCHTELDQIEGRLTPPQLPIVPGHQIVGEVVERAPDADRFDIGRRVGVTWLHWSCSRCDYCRTGRENLCDSAQWTGHDVNGGYAEYAAAYEKFAYSIPDQFSDTAAAPLLCAGVIGYRALRLTQAADGETIGLFGFGASAHIVIQIITHKHPACKVFVFTRGRAHRELALKLGADWAGAPDETPPALLNKAIDFTPVGESVMHALGNSAKAARLVINAIRKATPIPQMDYGRYLWGEREIKSVANVAPRDAEEFLPLAAEIPIVPEVEVYGLADANKALIRLKEGKVHGAAVLSMSSSRD
jgi:propanol-preferring alcohol dehydrogenase